MEALLGPLLSYVLVYKYAALFLIVYSAALIVPFPGNTMLLAVGAFASQGYFSFWLSLAVAVVANTLGDLSGYALTRRYGDAIIRVLRLHKARFFDYLKEELRTDAAVTVFTTRFAGSLSPIANFLAGIVAVPFFVFLVYDFLGNFIEPFVALALGYAVGSYWSDFSNIVSLFAAVVAVAVIMFVLIRIYRRIMRKYNGR